MPIASFFLNLYLKNLICVLITAFCIFSIVNCAIAECTEEQLAKMIANDISQEQIDKTCNDVEASEEN